MPNLPRFNIHHILFRSYFGFVAWIVFLVLRPGFDSAYYIRPEVSAEEIRAKSLEVAASFGNSGDSIGVIVNRIQFSSAWNKVKKTKSLQEWSASGEAMTGWEAVVAVKKRFQFTEFQRLESFFDQRGLLYLVFDESGTIREFRTREFYHNRFFIQAPSEIHAADSLIAFLGLSDFGRWNMKPDEKPIGDAFQQKAMNPVLERDFGKALKASVVFERANDLQVINGNPVAVDGWNVVAYKAGMPDRLAPNEAIFTPEVYAYILVYGVLLGFVLWAFFRRAVKGAIEWTRGIIVLAGIAALYLYWQMGYWQDIILSIDASADVSAYLFSEFINSILFGGFAAIAYLAWESMAREDGHAQLDIVDSFWRGKIFFRETGRAIIDGYSMAGIMLFISAIVLYGMNEITVLVDSRVGYVELLKGTPNVSLSANALFFGLVTATLQWGLGVQLFQNLKVKGWIRHVVSIVFLAIAASVAGRVTATSSVYWKDVLLAVCIAPFIYGVYLRSGIVTLITLLGVSFTAYHVLPFLQAANNELFNQGLLTLTLGLLPLAFGILASIWGGSVSVERRYRPKYLDQIEKQLRITNEIQIAAESQYTLLPQKTPEIQGASIKGFFIPSQEVGGDFFDYVPKTMHDGTAGIAFVVADVSGKAMKAAIQAIFTNGLILSRIRTDDPAKLLSEINGHVFDRTDSKTFVTALVGNYHAAKRELTIASAGHCKPILKRNGIASFIETPNPRYPLGIRASVQYAEISQVLEPGDFVFFYSDGLPEASDENGNYFGYDRLLSFISDLDTNRSAEIICSELREYIRTMKDFRISDDTTIVCLTILNA